MLAEILNYKMPSIFHNIELDQRNFYSKNRKTSSLVGICQKEWNFSVSRRQRNFGASAERAVRSVQTNFGGSNRERSKIEGDSAVCLTRGGRGTRMGGGPRWRRCCTGGGMFCCGRRRWWVCRVSPDLACLLQHLVYGVHVCPHGIKRHSNANCAPTVSNSAIRLQDHDISGSRASASRSPSHRSVFFFPFFRSFFLRLQMIRETARGSQESAIVSRRRRRAIYRRGSKS